jgi:hypothetical protein
MEENKNTDNQNVEKHVENMRVESVRPNNNCKKCNGTGRLGFIDGDRNKPCICQCVIKIYNKAREELKKKKLAAQVPALAAQETLPALAVQETAVETSNKDKTDTIAGT